VTFTEISARPDPACGVFETIAVRDGRVQALERHLDRLGAAVADLYGRRLPPDLAGRARAVAASLTGEHRLRVRAQPAADRLMVRIETEPRADSQQTVMLNPVIVPGGLGAYKWCDRRLLDSLSSPGVTPLIVDVGGEVLEAGWANVWIVEGGHIITPVADGRLLPGIIRSLVLERAPALGFTASTELISIARARQADAVFLTSSLRYAVDAALGGGPSAHDHSPAVLILRTALSAAGWEA